MVYISLMYTLVWLALNKKKKVLWISWTKDIALSLKMLRIILYKIMHDYRRYLDTIFDRIWDGSPLRIIKWELLCQSLKYQSQTSGMHFSPVFSTSTYAPQLLLAYLFTKVKYHSLSNWFSWIFLMSSKIINFLSLGIQSLISSWA